MSKSIFQEDEDFIRSVKEAVQKRHEPYLSDFIFPWDISLCRYALMGTGFELGEWGGYEGALRKRIASTHGKITRHMFRVSCYEFKPSSMLTYRNRRMVLDKLLSVGIVENKIGDILMASESYFLYMEILTSIHQIEDALLIQNENPPQDSQHKIQQNISGTISSPRLDSICALAFKPSREKIQGLIENGGAMVNYQYAFKPSKEIQEDSIISLRGFPRFKLINTGKATKKGRTPVEIEFLD